MYKYVIVGGGVHGTCLANYLLTEGGCTHDELCLVEPRDELLESFATKARQCGMETLRSTFVQHIDTEPFSLESFAEGRNREDELIPTDDYPKRPTLELFLDHARYVVRRRDIDDCSRQTRVTGVTPSQTALRVETAAGALDTRRVVLALGLGVRPTLPAWASSLPDDAPLAHVWDEAFDPQMAAQFEGQTVVVGGGITAAQLACHLAAQTDVTLLSRHELDVELTEAHPYWINWPHIEQRLHTLPPGSKARHERIRAARHDGTIPPYVEERVVDACNYDGLDVRLGEIACVHSSDEGLHVRLTDGTTMANAQVVLATGLDPISEHPLVDRLAQSLALPRGPYGFPVLDDQTLAWKRTDGTDSGVYVSGALAETTVGPLARNVVGARRVAERLLASHTEIDLETAAASSSGRS